MTGAELAAIRARCEAATPGPWRWGPFDDPEAPRCLTRKESYDGELDEAEDYFVLSCRSKTADDLFDAPDGDEDCPSDADAAFIAHARADVPALLAEVERLRALVQCWRFESHNVGCGCLKCVTTGEMLPGLPYYPSEGLYASREEA